MNILLDFDGILLRNNKVGKLIEQKSIDFVHKSLNISHSRCKHMNKFLYKTYGHTANGVAKSTSRNLTDVVSDYNDYVFKNMNYQNISHYLDKNDKDRLNTLLDEFKRISDSKYGLFTNAPLSWCENIFSCLENDMNEIIDYNKIFTSDNGLLKPNIITYNNIEEQLDNKIHFIDDSQLNLLPVHKNKKWKTYLMNSNMVYDLVEIVENIHKMK